MVDHSQNKQSGKIVEQLQELIESVRERGPEVMQKFRELGEALQQATDESTESKNLPTDFGTYAQVLGFLQSEIQQGGLRIVVLPQGGGRFYFYLQERRSHEIDQQGYLPEIGMSVERFNQIVMNEVFTILHYVYWCQRDAMVQQAMRNGQSEEEAIQKYEATNELLTPELQQGILLARSQSAHMLVYATHEIITRDMLTKDQTEVLHSALIRLLIRDNLLTDQDKPWIPVAFECTLADLAVLIEDLKGIKEKLERKNEARVS